MGKKALKMTHARDMAAMDSWLAYSNGFTEYLQHIKNNRECMKAGLGTEAMARCVSGHYNLCILSG
jgi:hypothetical protein